jgi:hypothetical protein
VSPLPKFLYSLNISAIFDQISAEVFPPLKKFVTPSITIMLKLVPPAKVCPAKVIPPFYLKHTKEKEKIYYLWNLFYNIRKYINCSFLLLIILPKFVSSLNISAIFDQISAQVCPPCQSLFKSFCRNLSSKSYSPHSFSALPTWFCY